MEEEKEFVDGEFQESEFIDEEFWHEYVEDLSQGLVDWDSPPTYDDEVNEEDPIEEPLASDLEEEHEEDGFFPIFGGLYLDEDDQLEDEEPMNDMIDYEEDDIADYKEVDEDLLREDVGYVDFLSVEDILNSPHDDYGEFYTDEENYIFTREIVADPFLSMFMAHGRKKEREKYNKPELLPSGVWSLHDNHQGMSMMKGITFIVGCCLVLILRKGEWNQLCSDPKY